MKRAFYSAALCAFTLSVSGCMSWGTAAPSGEQPPAKPELPFVLSVDQELNDGKRLYVRASVEALTTWSTSEVELHVAGYKDGVKVVEQRVPLSTLGPVIKSGEKKQVPVVLDAPDLSDYQIELLWGAENAARKPSHATDAGKKMDLRNIIISSERTACSANAECELKYALTANIYNSGDEVINDVVLGTGFIWLEGGVSEAADQVPESESHLELTELQLGPGASRKVKIELDRTVPERSDGVFKPVLRVVSIDKPTVDEAPSSKAPDASTGGPDESIPEMESAPSLGQ